MENVSEINRKIADNLIRCRKAARLTQAELAEKINYSDKSVSKWESGNGVPDIYTLMQIAELFNVTIGELVGEKAPPAFEQKMEKKTKGLHSLIMMLSSGIVWLVATCAFVLFHLIKPSAPEWLTFVYAIAINAIVIIVYSAIWKQRVVHFLAVSTLIWMSLTCIYLTARFVSIANGNNFDGLWTVFLLGIPLQVLEVLWEFFRSLFRKNKQAVESVPAEAPTEEVAEINE